MSFRCAPSNNQMFTEEAWQRIEFLQQYVIKTSLFEPEKADKATFRSKEFKFLFAPVF